MKILNYNTLWLLFLFFGSNCYCQKDTDHFYYYKGEKIFLKLDTTTIALSIKTDKDLETVQNIVSNNLHEKPIIQENNTRRLSKIIDQQARNKKNIKTYYTEIPSKQFKNKEAYRKEIDKYKKDPSISMASPCFISAGGKKIGLSNNFYVKLKNEGDVELLYDKARDLHIEILGHNEFMPLWFTLSCDKSTGINAINAANLFYETGLFESTQPEFMYHDLGSSITTQSQNSKSDTLQNVLTKSTIDLSQSFKSSFSNRDLVTSPNDPYYPQQWGLKNTGQEAYFSSGIDIKAEGAWTITTGSPTIKVAVVDSGIEKDHPDLKDNIFEKEYDVGTNSSESKVYGSHGTLMAGTIAAVQNNGIGISGVAPNCKLIPVSMNYSDGITPDETVANGINWAWQNGADIINLSMSTNLPDNLMEDAVNDAYVKGRNGKGTLIVSSSGNQNLGTVNWPGRSSLVLSVGAINYYGERFMANSQAGSNYGNGLDVMAPGVVIVTTDLLGQPGANNIAFNDPFPDLDYSYSTGTSIATAHVSGIAALILSINPELTAQEVKDIIEKSAQKIRPSIFFIYSKSHGHPNGPWNNEMGYGLVNAQEAVVRAANTIICLPEETVTDNAPSIDFKQVSEFITASNVISSTANAIYQAGHYILLQTGFLAESGCTFKAGIEECSGNSQRNTFYEKKITYPFRYNTPENEITENQNQLKAEPNPFTHTITINYAISSNNSGKVNLDVYTMEGKKVANLVDDTITVNGTHTVEWDASHFPSGTYLVTLTTPYEKKTLKVVKL